MSRLGKHRLMDKSIIDKILLASNIYNNDVVFEIGTGDGILTQELCKRARHVISCEIDYNLYNIAKNRLDYSNLTLLNTDGINYGLLIEFDKFVSNIPYSRSKDIIELLAIKDFDLAVMMVQREFANKLLKGKKAVSIIARYCFDIEYLYSIPRHVFKPMPQVDSSIIRLRKKASMSKEEVSKVKLLYSFKGKKVKNAKGFSMDIDKRVEDLEPEEVISIIKHV